MSNGDRAGRDTDGPGLVLLTCSMARDREIFAILAASVDACAGPDVRHVVIVPRRDLAAFAPYAGPRREILAQEDVLPMRLWPLPKMLSRLAFLHDALRRPLYLTGSGKVIRGWMIQQLLKIEYARQAPAEAVVHVDSDVFFVRPFGAADVVRDGLTAFFRAEPPTLPPALLRSNQVAAECLGLTLPEGWTRHYIENCVPWSRDVTQAMVARIQTVHGKAYHEVLMGMPTISEYFIYGLYADLVLQKPCLRPADRSLCHSFWPDSPDATYDVTAQISAMQPWHKALAVQSTHDFPLTARAEALARALGEVAR